MKPQRPKRGPARCAVCGERLTSRNVPIWPELGEGDPLWRFTWCYGCGGNFCDRHDAIPFSIGTHTIGDHARYEWRELGGLASGKQYRVTVEVNA